MNPAPDQPPASNVSSVSSDTSTPIPSTPSATSPIVDQPTTNNLQPTTFSPPPTPPPQSAPHRHFPFMMVTLFLAVILAGFAGSFLFFQYTGKPSKKPTSVLITPPATISPTSFNPFATASADLGTNPFASPTAVTNPFGTYQNPFGGATVSATPKPLQNPF